MKLQLLNCNLIKMKYLLSIINYFINDNIFYFLLIINLIIFQEKIPKYYYFIELCSHIIMILLLPIFYYIDTNTGWWAKYKIIKRQTKLTYGDMLPKVILNNIMASIIYNIVLLPLSNYRGFIYYKTTNINIIIDVFAIYLIYDMCFYTFHKIIHYPQLYNYIHKLHHQTYGDIAISSHYMTLPDYFLELIIPFWIAITIYNPNYLASLIFIIIGQINGLITHSGYNFPTLPNPDNHQLHHLILKRHFGVGGPWDLIFNTK